MLSLFSLLLRTASLPFRAAAALYALLIGRPHFLVALLECLACVATAATARPPLAAAATVLSTQPWLWWGTAGVSTGAGYAASLGVAFLALYSAGERAARCDEDVAHAVAALVWGPLWWSAAAAGVPRLLGGPGWARRAAVLLGRLAVTALYAKATSAAQWAGPRGAGGEADWEGEAHPVLPPLDGAGGPAGASHHGSPHPPHPSPAAAPDRARVLGGGDLYAVLGVPRDAPAAAVRVARARALRACHPDKASAGEDGDAPLPSSHLAAAAAVERITRAAALLSDEGRRSEYDARLARWEAALAVTESLPVTPPVGFRGSESGGVRQ